MLTRTQVGTAHWQPQPKDATDEIWMQDSEEISFECVDARRQTTTDNCPSYKLWWAVS